MLSVTFRWFVLVLLETPCLTGPALFRFSAEPQSTTLSPGGSTTLSCVATGRDNIKYSWYRRQDGFSTDNLTTNDTKTETLHYEQDVTTYQVQYNNVGDWKLYQCSAHSGGEVIFSDTSRIDKQTGIKFTGNKETSNIKVEKYRGSSTRKGDDNIVTILPCNTDVDNTLSLSDQPFVIQWYKEGETGSVETNHDNMWTFYKSAGDEIEFAIDNPDPKGDPFGYSTEVKEYNLVIISIRSNQNGTYKCKAVSLSDPTKEVTLSERIVTFDKVEAPFTLYTVQWVAGYKVLSVEDTVYLNDNAVVMCGSFCNKYKWEKSTGDSFTGPWSTWSTLTETGSVITVKLDERKYFNYRCTLHSSCGTYGSAVTLTSKTITIPIPQEPLDAVTDVKFNKTPPQYIWYDKEDNTASSSTTISCSGSVPRDTISFSSGLYTNGVKNKRSQTSIKVDSSTDSGVYQCAIFNTPAAEIWLQQTTEVVVSDPARVSMSPTGTKELELGDTLTITCTFHGYPRTKINLTDPSSLPISCPGIVNNRTCNKNSDIEYVIEISYFTSSLEGSYTCKMESEFWKTNLDNLISTSETKSLTTKYVMPSKTELEADRNLIWKGSTFTLTCTVEGYPPPQRPTLWKNQASDTFTSCDGGTNKKVCTKKFTNAGYDDAAVYECKTNNTVRGTYSPSSDKANIVISSKVSVSLALSSLPSRGYFITGDSVTLTCIADGFPLAHYMKISRDGQLLFEYNTGAGVNKGKHDITYKMNTDKLTDIGKYKCEAKNQVEGNVYSDYKEQNLKIYEVVKVTIQIDKQYPKKGDSIKITCVATGSDTPSNVKLYQKLGSNNEVLLKDSSVETSFCKTENYKLTCIHTINSAGYSDNGEYWCFGKNNVNGVEKTAKNTTTVEISSDVLVQLIDTGDKEVELGSKYTITCTVDGGKVPYKVELLKPDKSKLTWQKSGTSNTLSCTPDNNIDNILKCRHGIDKTLYNGEGVYKCTGYNQLPNSSNDKSDNKDVNIIVTEDVTVRMSPSSTEVDRDSAVKLTCEAEGGRVPHVLQLVFNGKYLINYNTDSGTNTEGVTISGHTITYKKTISKVSFDDSGTYYCTGKNKAKENVEKTDKDNSEITVVSDVTISSVDDVDVDLGDVLQIPKFTVEGGRAPHEVILAKPDGKTDFIYSNSVTSKCTGTFTKSCDISLGASTYQQDGNYKITAKNRAKQDKVVTAGETFSVTVYKNVEAKISLKNGGELITDYDKVRYGISLTVECKVEGGKMPHLVELTMNSTEKYLYKRNDQASSNLTCTGEHVLTCLVTMTTGYHDDGIYGCKGYNKVRNNTEKESYKSVDITVYRDLIISSISTGSSSIVTNGSTTITCVVGGKPIIEAENITWEHENSAIDLEGNFTTIKGSDDYTLISTLTLNSPSVDYNGNFSCIANGTLKETQSIAIAEKYFLEIPFITSLDMTTVEKDSVLVITCSVRGFSNVDAELFITNVEEEKLPVSEGIKTVKADYVTEFVFKYNVRCGDVSITCIGSAVPQITVQTKISTSFPEITSCSEMLPIVAGSTGGGFVIIIIIIVVVLVILKKRGWFGKRKSELADGCVQYPNLAYVTSSDNLDSAGSPGYSHLHRPNIEGQELEGYASLNNILDDKPNKLDDDGYATMDTKSNNKQPISAKELYSRLEQGNDLYEKKVVMKRYKPIAPKIKTVPPKPQAAASNNHPVNATEDDDAYARLGDYPPKSVPVSANKADDGDAYAKLGDYPPKSAPVSAYVDITIPAHTPPDPVYAENSILPEEPTYSQVIKNNKTSLKKKLPNKNIEDIPPEVPIYDSNRGLRDADEDEPLYAAVNINNKNRRIQQSEEPEDIAPEVPIYGTNADFQESSENDTYARVQYVPKKGSRQNAQNKPPNPKDKTVYATMSDLKKT